MPEIVVISGKGGTGKTTVTAALAHLARQPVVCDLDVDAPDLHLLLQPTGQRTEEFYSGHEAVIDAKLCQACGVCRDLCRFGAIQERNGAMEVDPLRCEGCKVCVNFCPAQAIAFPERHCGRWYVSRTRFGPLVHAQLFPGQENSGRLVALLRRQAKDMAERQGRDLIISDGSPGIGCPVISSLTGVDLAVAVTEPTPSGRHDLERVSELCEHFRVPMAVIINKYDLSSQGNAEIESLCRERNLMLVTRLPFDPAVVEAQVRAEAVTEDAESPVGQALRQGWPLIEQMARTAKAA